MPEKGARLLVALLRRNLVTPLRRETAIRVHVEVEAIDALQIGDCRQGALAERTGAPFALSLIHIWSHDIAANGVVVPESHTFPLNPARMTRTEPLYRFPMLFTFKLGAVALGSARAAIDDVLDISAKKATFGTTKVIRDQEWLHVAIARAEMTYAQARASYYEATRAVWAEMLAGEHPSKLTVARMNLAQIGAVERSIEIVDAMYKAGGSASLYARNTLDRRLRDVHTMGQHTVMSHRSLTESGRALLGL